MSDPQNTTPPEGETPEPEFDWGNFFLGDGETPSPVTPETTAPPVETPTVTSEDDTTSEDDPRYTTLLNEIEALKTTVKQTNQTTSEIAFRDQKRTAIDNWKKTATPEALAMADLLEEATSPEDIKARAEVITKATDLLSRNMTTIEQNVQRKFGLPVTPTFQPIPDSERVEKMLEENDLEGAANAMLKGMFNS